jgi:hypothetical protein
VRAKHNHASPERSNGQWDRVPTALLFSNQVFSLPKLRRPEDQQLGVHERNQIILSSLQDATITAQIKREIGVAPGCYELRCAATHMNFD